MKISLISIDEFQGSLGLRSISSCLKNKGHAVQMIFLIPHERLDYNSSLSPNIMKKLVSLVKDSDTIGISSMTNESKETINTIKYLKKVKKPIVWGGINATSSLKECIQYADMVCIGEGEEAFCELVDSIEKKLPHLAIKNF